MTTTQGSAAIDFQERAGYRRTMNGIRNSSLPILIAVVFVVASISVPQFLTFETIRAILLATSITGIIAAGMTAITWP